MDGMVPLSVRGDIKKKSRQNFSGGGGGNEPRRDPIKDLEQFSYAKKPAPATAATPKVPRMPKAPELPSDMLLDNEPEFPQTRGTMPTPSDLSKALDSLDRFTKDVRRGKI